MTTKTNGIAGKRVIVTGASSGLGAHITRRLASEGASVVAAARRTDRLEVLREELSGVTGSVATVEADVTVADDVARVVDAALSGFASREAASSTSGRPLSTGPRSTDSGTSPPRAASRR
jgi:NADP-dependent 3-hydroxy acid dehydrogenase YdfG